MNQLFSFFQNNSDAILAGIISSLIVILLQAAVISLGLTIFYFFTRKLGLRRAFNLKFDSAGKRAFVVSGTLKNDKNPGLAVLQGPDALAAANTVSTMEVAYPDVDIKHLFCNTVTESSYDENMVAVGGPIFNTVCKAILDQTKGTVYFDDEEVVHIGSKTFKQVVNTESGTVEKDIGIFLRMTSPWHRKRTVVVIAGVGSAGVISASYLYGRKSKNPELAQAVRKEIGLVDHFLRKDFVAIISCEGFANDAYGLKLEYASTLATLAQ